MIIINLRGLKHIWADFCLLKACHNTKPGECFKRFFHRNYNKACLAQANNWGNIILEIQQEIDSESKYKAVGQLRGF